MARGVTDQFLKIVERDRHRALLTLFAALALVAPAYFLAELADAPRLGAVAVTFFAALVVAFIAGLITAWRHYHRVNKDLKERWTTWMRFSTSAGTLDDVERKVQGKAPASTALKAAGLALLVIGNGVAFALLWAESPAGPFATALAVILDGITLGLTAAGSLWLLGWCTLFRRAVGQLVEEGQMGIWGER
ncbi:MAG TPA: hypothetical protein VNZ52_02540 [Candidatus Thermoplasmatota archaeon]|nr:hypothetical protein [Candidatus Thermoplasmatota archaeon]